MLPNIQNPEFELELPSTGELVHYRPFLVKEEKILLVALEGGNASEITNSIYQIIRNCIRPDVTDVMDMTYFTSNIFFSTLDRNLLITLLSSSYLMAQTRSVSIRQSIP